MTINLKEIEVLLKNKHLLKEFVTEDGWYFNLPNEDKAITHLSYDSRDISSETLFLFEKNYLKKSKKRHTML